MTTRMMRKTKARNEGEKKMKMTKRVGFGADEPTSENLPADLSAASAADRSAGRFSEVGSSAPNPTRLVIFIFFSPSFLAFVFLIIRVVIFRRVNAIQVIAIRVRTFGTAPVNAGFALAFTLPFRV